MKGALILTWDEFNEAVLAACEEVRDSDWFQTCTGVYGIPRGGLCLAVALSHHLELPLLSKPRKACLVVDDCLETGHTYVDLMNEYNLNGKIAAWVWVSKNPTLNKGYMRFVDPEQWVVFPWEDYAKARKDRGIYERRSTR